MSRPPPAAETFCRKAPGPWFINAARTTSRPKGHPLDFAKSGEQVPTALTKMRRRQKKRNSTATTRGLSKTILGTIAARRELSPTVEKQTGRRKKHTSVTTVGQLQGGY